MFRLIPLRSLVRNTTQRIDHTSLVDFSRLVSVQRETIAPNWTSPGYNDLPRSWNMMPNNRNTLLITAGTLEFTVYSLQERKQSSLVLSSDNVYLDGKMYYGSPSMLEWGSGTAARRRRRSPVVALGSRQTRRLGRLSSFGGGGDKRQDITDI